ncbi:hypothetical protein TIFTF001_030728 [Ficus carica]|uniref:Remorin C-terminal domain-containing protein n=1 Tax=Ficus carica TaxID=3494 RepID=A0AA88DUY5_FICCA|nr:hypothetical protein TIFTF001_030728 [Ficus carica]
MDYERIQKPQGGGGFSPGKLRMMLMGVEKQRKKEEDPESAFTLRSQPFDVDESGGSSLDNCKDVDVVSVLPECSTSTTADSLGSEMVSDRRLMDNSNGTTVNSRARNQRDPSLDYDIGYDGMTASPSIFEFQKGERVQQRVPIAPFSKPAPSKWDDAQKWIASPTSNRPKAGQSVGSRKVSRQLSTKVVVEVPDQKAVAFDEPDTKQIDMNQTKLESWGQKLVPWEADACPTTESYSKPVLMIENSVGESAISYEERTDFVEGDCIILREGRGGQNMPIVVQIHNLYGWCYSFGSMVAKDHRNPFGWCLGSLYVRRMGRQLALSLYFHFLESFVNLSRHSSSVAIQSAMTFIPPPSTARSVSMRDMGTEMTPIASQEPSRTGTPVRATTPIRSPTSSRPSTPPRTAPELSLNDPPIDNLDPNRALSEKELQMKTRREIMALGTQLGKTNIAAWASKEEEDKDASTSLKNLQAEQQAKGVIEMRATAWEEAEKAKYMARLI